MARQVRHLPEEVAGGVVGCWPAISTPDALRELLALNWRVADNSERESRMESVFVYWDNLNIFYEAQRFAIERKEGSNARYRACINFENMLRLAHANRPLENA